MRLLPIVAAGASLALVGGAVSATAVGASRHSTFSAEAASLERTWNTDIAEGVPASSFAPLRAELNGSPYSAGWWSPAWWTGNGDSLITDLQARTQRLWTATVDAARAAAHGPITGFAQLESRLGPFVPAAAAAEAAGWPAQLQAAHTPAALRQLAASFAEELAAATTQAETAQAAARSHGQRAAFAGVSALLSRASAALSTARADNLDSGTLAALITALRQEVSSGSDTTATVAQLMNALAQTQALIALNDRVAAGLRAVLLAADQAAAEGTPGASGFLTQYSGLASALRAATDQTALDSVQAQVQAEMAAIKTQLAADVCGHAVGSGKVITVNLTLQEIVFYDNGCEVAAGPVTTGRPQLRTPTGTFHVFYKKSPFQFISPWPKGSPFYYYPSWTHWVMEFAAGGYFLHDAPWEPDSELGPGSENSNSSASHGCIHLAGSLMQWAYGWTPMGTPVVITG